MAKKKNEISILRSSAAEYLTFLTATGQSDVNAIYADENVWLSQKMMGLLYDVEAHTITYHLQKTFKDGELDKSSVTRIFRVTASDGKTYDTKHFNLKAIIAVGNKVDSPRAVQFRKWANDIIEEYTIKGFAMDDERLKNDGTVLTKKYFEEQLQRIREIRLSERKFYQKITDIYATSIDYDKTAKTTKTFFATVQNKLHWAIHKHTAAELIMTRVDYVSMYLDYAEMQAERNIPMTMEDWAKRLDAFLQFNEMEILKNYRKVTEEIDKAFAETEFEKYRLIQDKLFESDFDKFLIDATECTIHDGSEDHE